MKKSRAGFWVGAASLFMAVIYSIVLFLVKTALNVSTWILYGFTMTAFLFMTIQSVASYRKGARIFLEMALSIVTLIYFSLQLLFGGIVCMCLSNLPVMPVLICEIVFCAAYLTTIFILFGVQSHRDTQDHNDGDAVRKMRLLEKDILSMAETLTDAEIKNALKTLAEEIHFCNVVVSPALADTEDCIARNVAILRHELMDETADACGRINTIHRLLQERNQIAPILKQ